jgi:hypothetical protein
MLRKHDDGTGSGAPCRTWGTCTKAPFHDVIAVIESKKLVRHDAIWTEALWCALRGPSVVILFR